MINKTRQRGATLLVGLVMLLVLTLLAVSAIRSSTLNLRVARNMQVQNEVKAAAQQAIEQVISSNFTASPAAQSIGVDVNGDGTADFTANVLLPNCTATVPINNEELDPAVAADLTCIKTTQVGGNLILQPNGKPLPGSSWCYKQHWNVQATVNDSGSGAQTSLTQGVKLRVPAGTTC